jgi:hypothetical protein
LRDPYGGATAFRIVHGMMDALETMLCQQAAVFLHVERCMIKRFSAIIAPMFSPARCPT